MGGKYCSCHSMHCKKIWWKQFCFDENFWWKPTWNVQSHWIVFKPIWCLRCQLSNLVKSASTLFSLRVTLDTHHSRVVRRYVQCGLTKLLPKPVSSASEKPSVLFCVLLLSRRYFPALIKLTLLQYSSCSSGKWLGKQTNELFLFWGTKFPLSWFFHSHCVSRELWESVISLTRLMLFFRSCHVGDFHQYLIAWNISWQMNSIPHYWKGVWMT